MKKFLFLGTDKVLITKLLQQHLKASPITEPWLIISSYAKTREAWQQECNNSSFDIQQPKDIKSPDDLKTYSNIILDHVIATALYEPEFKKVLLATQNLWVALHDPIAYFDSELIESFQVIHFTKTGVAAKLNQYYNLFLGKTDIPLLKFKERIKVLEPEATLCFTTQTKKLETQQPLPAASSGSSCGSTPNSTNPNLNPGSLLKPSSAPPLSSQVVEGFLSCWTTRPDTVASELKKSLAAPLLTAMLHYHSQQKTSNRVLLYFQIKSMRQDLFTALSLNILRNLKEKGLLQHGGFMI